MMRRSFFVFAAILWTGLTLPFAGAQAQSPDGADADYDKRLQRLEEQIVDLNAQLGTIETISQQGGGAALPTAPADPGSGGFGGADDPRLADLETQLRALSSQMSDMVQRLDRLEQRSGAVSPSQQPRGAETDYANTLPDRLDGQPAEQGTGFSVGGNQPSAGGFDAAIVPEQSNSNANGGLSGYFDPGSQDVGKAPSAAGQPIQTAARSSPEAHSLYQKAYDALVQRNYRGAAEDFQQFVQTFPADPLAGPAHYWLGEAAFINGQYRQAADNFLKSSTNYPQNEKAAESLLKLGISLKRLGESNAACSSFAELSRRFPSATPILQRAEREKNRSQC
jgi:tol-pal system protein YbgF